jgi:hypothetical protein
MVLLDVTASSQSGVEYEQESHWAAGAVQMKTEELHFHPGSLPCCDFWREEARTAEASTRQLSPGIPVLSWRTAL